MQVSAGVDSFQLTDKLFVTVETEKDASEENLLHAAILKTLVPQASAVTEEALLNSKRKRKRVQSVDGEFLTKTEALDRLLQEKEERERRQ